MEPVHLNVDCSHNNSPIARLRAMVVAKNWRDAQHELARINEKVSVLRLGEIETVAFSMYGIEIDLATERRTIETAEPLLSDAVIRGMVTGNCGLVADLQSRRILMCRYYGASMAHVQRMRAQFFDSIIATPITKAHHALCEGMLNYWEKGPAQALTIFLRALSQLDRTTRPCLYESLCRYIAAMWTRLGNHKAAHSTLLSGNIPTEYMPVTFMADGSPLVRDTPLRWL